MNTNVSCPDPTRRPLHREDRVLGRHDQGRPGPCLILVGGLHGNEPEGAQAVQEVLETLEREQRPIAGSVLGLVGNRRALAGGVRYLKRDMNRSWAEGLVAPDLDVDELEGEDAECAELAQVLDQELRAARGPVVLLDLHSTSAGGAPFALFADTAVNRRLAQALPLPVLLGLEERIRGPLISLFSDLGHAALVVEGGRSGEALTCRHHVASIWLTLVASGAVSSAETPEALPSYELLEQATRDLPRYVEVEYAHAIGTNDRFVMAEGYLNFDSVELGDVVARVASGAVRFPLSGYLLMPLYQGQGEDGFFLGREITRSWLSLSSWLRGRRDLEQLLPALPGVRSVVDAPLGAGRTRALELDPRGVRPIVRTILTLFGYRRRRWSGPRLLVERRPEQAPVLSAPS